MITSVRLVWQEGEGPGVRLQCGATHMMELSCIYSNYSSYARNYLFKQCRELSIQAIIPSIHISRYIHTTVD